jgi:hypothetical protein
VAPVDGATQRALAVGQVAPRARQHGQAVVEPAENLGRCEQLMRAAASSMASGRLSTRRHMAATSAALPSVSRSPAGLHGRARGTTQRTPILISAAVGRLARPAATRRHRDAFAREPSGSRLSRGHAGRGRQQRQYRAAPTTCSRLSSTSRDCALDSLGKDYRKRPPGCSGTLRTCAIVAITSSDHAPRRAPRTKLRRERVRLRATSIASASCRFRRARST